MKAARQVSVAQYLLIRMKQLGVDHLFGVPGDFVLGFLNQVLESELDYVGTCNELNAAYAADGYARIRGLGAFACTYGAGELSAINGVAGAFAEKVPLLVIAGSPTTSNFRQQPLLHHTLGDYGIPMAMYEKITGASARLDRPEDAPAEIDRVLSACLALKLPVYLSLPSDCVMSSCAAPGPWAGPGAPWQDPAALREAADEAALLLDQSKRPVVIGGVELIRFGLQGAFEALLEKSGFPYATMMLAKTLLSERHPQFMGLFEGSRSREGLRQRVASADCVLELGASMSDFNTGGFSAGFDAARTIAVNLGQVRIKNHAYARVNLGDFIVALTQRLQGRQASAFEILAASEHATHRPGREYLPVADKPLSIARFFDRMSHFIKDGALVVAETGVSLFSAAEMLMPEGATFIGQAFYGSIGYTVGATLGACTAAPARQALLFVGDGAFQVTCQDLSTMIRQGLKPVIFLINNDGYTIERVVCDRPYNDLQPWRYHELVKVFGGGLGLDVHSEGELEDALRRAVAAETLVFIEIHTGRLDCPPSLVEAGRAMAKANALEAPGS